MKTIAATVVSLIAVCTALDGAGCSGASVSPNFTPADSGSGSGGASESSGGGSSTGGSSSGGYGASSGSSSSGSSSGPGSSGGSGSSGSSGASGSSGTTGSSGGSGADAGGSACVTSTDCSGGQICGFPESAGCSATGSCFQAPGVTCEAIALACACDGTDINVACNGLPSGYAPKPYAHAGTCGADAGAVTGPMDASGLADGATCVASNGDPCGAGLSCCPTAGYADAPTACTPTCTGSGCAGSCRALP